MQNRKTYLSYENYVFIWQKKINLKIIECFLFFVFFFDTKWKINIFLLLTGSDAQLLFVVSVPFWWRIELRKRFSAGKCVSDVSLCIFMYLYVSLCIFLFLTYLYVSLCIFQTRSRRYVRIFTYLYVSFRPVPEDTYVSLRIFMYLSDRFRKIHKDT